MQTVNVVEAKSRFSELLSRTVGGEEFIIQRRQKPVAVLIGLAEWEQLKRTAQTVRNMALNLGQSEEILQQIDDQKMHPIMAVYGLWKDEPEFDTLIEEIYQAREDDLLLDSHREVSFEDIGQ